MVFKNRCVASEYRGSAWQQRLQSCKDLLDFVAFPSSSRCTKQFARNGGYTRYSQKISNVFHSRDPAVKQALVLIQGEEISLINVQSHVLVVYFFLHGFQLRL